ncbi:hypothetical protein BGX28_008836 [Mortierella sp. GBA30]|nr:hypothetical protein BGX28_008836 [Mortierella sp. GBA30]
MSGSGIFKVNIGTLQKPSLGYDRHQLCHSRDLVLTCLLLSRGINSFTVYTVALTLCDPVKSRVTSSSTRNRSRDVPSRTGQVGQWDTGMHAGHAPAGSSFTNNQTPVERSETRRCGGQNSMTGERTPLDHRPPLGRSASSKASLMMTRSMSFPELGYSAERLLMEVARVDEAPPLPGSEPPTSFTNTQNSESVSATESPAGPPRVIHVRKRYSDFVALRARLVETYRDPGSGGSPRGRPMFPRASIASSAMPRVSPYNPLPIHHPSRDSEGEDGAYADEYSRGGVDAHSQPMSSTSTTNAIVSCSSIIRGMPKLPPKKVVGKFRPAFVERRRRELEYFLEWVVAHPIIGDCPVVVQWFLGQT